MSIKPMLGSAITDYSKLTFPKCISPKLDGIFCMILDGVVVSRTGKPIRNKFVQETFGKQEYNNLSGELIYGSPVAPDCFNKTTQFVMSEEIKEGFDPNQLYLFVFDYIDDEMQFMERFGTYIDKVYNVSTQHRQMVTVDQKLIFSLEELEEEEALFLNQGYEGAMLRNPKSLYKHGRATEKSQDLLKVKRFTDAEAVVIGFEEKMHNTNEAKKDVFGHTERSMSKAGMVPANTLGALLVKDLLTGVEFGIGSGFNDAQRKEIWETRYEWVGKIVKYKHFAVGAVEAPRFPIFISGAEFVGERHKDDL